MDPEVLAVRAERHRHAANRHEEPRERHEQAAARWEASGDAERAALLAARVRAETWI